MNLSTEDHDTASPMVTDGSTSKSERPTAVRILDAKQRTLVLQVVAANMPGNLEGLFAYHVLESQPDFPLSWDVNPATPGWLAQNASRLAHAPMLAALGYGMRHFRATAPPSAFQQVTGGLARLRLRDPFPDDRLSFAFDPVTFLGVALAAKSVDGIQGEYGAWLLTVLKDARCNGTTPYQRLMYGYVQYVLSSDIAIVDDVREYRDVTEAALLEWLARHGAVRIVDPRVDLPGLQEHTLQAALLAEVAMLGAPRAAIVWSATYECLVSSVSALVLSRSHVGEILRQFEPSMRRWRWDDPAEVKHPIQWEIVGEREVQDILWLILRSVFHDVVDEETLPRVGHSTYRADFGIPSLRLLVEAKFARKAGDFKALEKEIMEDSVAYLIESKDRYDRIIVFIYDDSASVQEHELTQGAIRKIPQVEDVIIVSRPSQLPNRTDQHRV